MEREFKITAFFGVMGSIIVAAVCIYLIGEVNEIENKKEEIKHSYYIGQGDIQ